MFRSLEEKGTFKKLGIGVLCYATIFLADYAANVSKVINHSGNNAEKVRYAETELEKMEKSVILSRFLRLGGALALEERIRYYGSSLENHMKNPVY